MNQEPVVPDCESLEEHPANSSSSQMLTILARDFLTSVYDNSLDIYSKKNKEEAEAKSLAAFVKSEIQILSEKWLEKADAAGEEPILHLDLDKSPAAETAVASEAQDSPKLEVYVPGDSTPIPEHFTTKVTKNCIIEEEREDYLEKKKVENKEEADDFNDREFSPLRTKGGLKFDDEVDDDDENDEEAQDDDDDDEIDVDLSNEDCGKFDFGGLLDDDNDTADLNTARGENSKTSEEGVLTSKNENTSVKITNAVEEGKPEIRTEASKKEDPEEFSAEANENQVFTLEINEKNINDFNSFVLVEKKLY